MIIKISLCFFACIFSLSTSEKSDTLPITGNHSPQKTDMVLVEGGTFQMGSNDGTDIEKPVHTVTVSDFYIGRTEVTVGEYLEFVKATGKHQPEWLEPGSRYNIETGFDTQYKRMGDALTNPDQPIVGVSWYDAVAYCEWLSEKDGLQYRLPTEAEWEFAARGGNESAGHMFSGSNDLEEVAWVRSNSNEVTHPVGQKKANELGLHDMSGNVCEWCHDFYGEYPSSIQTDPKGPENGLFIVFRGGAYSSWPERCTVTFRKENPKMAQLKGIGFRLARNK